MPSGVGVGVRVGVGVGVRDRAGVYRVVGIGHVIDRSQRYADPQTTIVQAPAELAVSSEPNTALVSAITRIPVRRDVAMTGEITLRGRVTPIGGLKEKCLAAHRLGIKTVVIPRDNKRDLREVPKVIRAELKIVLVDYVDEVLREALVLEKPDSFFRAVDVPPETPVS